MYSVNHLITHLSLVQKVHITTSHRYNYPDKNAVSCEKPELNFTKHVTPNISRQVRKKENGKPKGDIKFLLGFC
jgi:hypothetical protein